MALLHESIRKIISLMKALDHIRLDGIQKTATEITSGHFRKPIPVEKKSDGDVSKLYKKRKAG